MNPELLLIIEVVSAVLTLILFFKIWAMTNDVRAIKEELLNFEPNRIYARAFAIPHARKFLESRPRVKKVHDLDDEISCSLMTDGSYKVQTIWNASTTEAEGNSANAHVIYKHKCRVTLHLACKDFSAPMSPDSWIVKGEPTANILD